MRTIVPMSKPTLKWAPASCPQASAVSTCARRSVTRTRVSGSTGIQASVPANGNDSTSSAPDMPREITKPPAEATGRDMPSLRRNQ